ncbi:MAG: ABC transporter permease subunit/CPBP intramembrane protease [Planctomycetaceae bacterium]
MSGPQTGLGNGGGLFGRLTRLTLKEMRETLRDRRTIVTLVLMPILVYPLLGVAFEKLLVTTLTPLGVPIYRIGVESRDAEKTVGGFLRAGESFLWKRRVRDRERFGSKSPSAAESDDRNPHGPTSRFEFEVTDRLDGDVASGQVDVGVRLPSGLKVGADTGFPDPSKQVPFELVHAEGSPTSDDALRLVERCFEAFNNEVRVRRLEQAGVPRHVVPAHPFRRAVKRESGGSGRTIGALIPLILILMTITGAVYPSIDLTAGERERGTLEMLVAAPVPRMGLLMAKYLTVLLVAVLTATMNLVSMTATIFATGLGPRLFEGELSVAVVFQVFGLLVLLAMFFSAVLLAVTSFARSFKEAQAYLIPLMIVSIAPGIFSMMPDVHLEGLLVVMPLANIVLLARDLFMDGFVQPLTAVVVVLSTLVYALAAIMVAARIFGTDAILYGSSGTWSEAFRRPQEASPACTPLAAVLGLALTLPVTFLLHHFAMQWFSGSGETRLVASAIVTALAFGGIPLAIVAIRNVRAQSAFSFRGGSIPAFAGAALLGVSLWPFVYEMILGVESTGLVTIDESIKKLAHTMKLQLKETPPLLTVTALAVVPAAFEELFFRGFLLSAFRTRLSDNTSILVTAAIFGAFHVIVGQSLGVERLLPSFCLGLVLGFVCVRSGSLFPGVVLHAMHNGFLVSLIYLEDWLQQNNWDVAAESHIPLPWLATAAAIAAAGGALLYFGTKAGNETTSAVTAGGPMQ